MKPYAHLSHLLLIGYCFRKMHLLCVVAPMITFITPEAACVHGKGVPPEILGRKFPKIPEMQVDY